MGPYHERGARALSEPHGMVAEEVVGAFGLVGARNRGIAAQAKAKEPPSPPAWLSGAYCYFRTLRRREDCLLRRLSTVDRLACMRQASAKV